MEKANADKPITKESIDKKLGFDFTTYDDGSTTDTESYFHYGDPFDVLTDEELEFVIEYFVDRDKPITKESIDKKLGFDFTTYDDGISIDTESDIPHENPFDVLTDKEIDFIIDYGIEQINNN
ncbi:hypothetical protein SAMN05421767_13610 [Granulicatella balaenopterae]|uniref:Uncharacterized protein n=1 Tax=Granulicatella balaenopterae TaxID=137733 RepID=A0A1H9N7X1_9LACT|nr:hypothetical protein [Granulicatella balaenopterae]SER31998.1 hypothetical protein SAMN05421767_13610 [Granulicatella balaenopterae]